MNTVTVNTYSNDEDINSYFCNISTYSFILIDRTFIIKSLRKKCILSLICIYLWIYKCDALMCGSWWVFILIPESTYTKTSVIQRKKNRVMLWNIVNKNCLLVLRYFIELICEGAPSLGNKMLGCTTFRQLMNGVVPPLE